MRTDDLVGAVWLPGDGKANPADITQALAKGARNNGVRIFEKTRVTAIDTKDGPRDRVTGVQTTEGAITAEVVVNCAGQWARQVGRMVGVTVPLYSCEHMYIVTEKMEGVPRDLPVMRDPDGYIYFKEEVGGLLMGGFEPEAKPWNKDVIPDDFEFGMLPDDWDQFQILMDNALIRVPALEKTGIKTFMNGPESFTPDLNYILGEAPRAARASSSAPASIRWVSRARAAPAWRWPNGSSPASRRSICGRSTSAASPISTATTPGCATASPRRSACTTRCRGRSASMKAAGRSVARRFTIASSRAAPGSATRWAGTGPTGLRASARRRTCSMAGVAAPGSTPSPPSTRRRARR